MTQEFQIDIPSTLRDIKLSQWQRYAYILEKNKDAKDTEFLDKKALEIFCNVDYKDINKLPFSAFGNVISHISTLLNSKTDLVKTFTLRGTDDVEVEFGFIPNLDKMSYGEFEDLESYIFDEANTHKAMAVLYRPIKYKKGDRYLIEDYDGTDYLKEVMKDTPLDVVLGAKVFFYRLARKLGHYTMDSTLKQLQKEREANSENHSEESGELIKQYITSLKEMLKESERLLN